MIDRGRAMPKLLVLAYYFPPSGGPGVQRTLRLVRHLPAFGWDPTVVTVRPEDAAWPSIDPTLEAEVPASIRVVRTPAFDPYAAYARWTGRARSEAVSVGFADDRAPGVRERVARWLRANLFLPDARVGWVRHARRAGLELVRETPFDAIWSTGPPHSTHLAARSIAREAGIAWVADFRDAWPDPSYAHRLPTSRAARAFDDALRRRVLRSVDGVTAVGQGMADVLRAESAVPVTLVENGFEEEDFADVIPLAHEGFELLYTGNMPVERNPQALWEALSTLRGQVPRLRVRMVGTIDAAVLEAVARAGVSDLVKAEPVVPHGAAVQAMVSADALLLSINRSAAAEQILTGKLYEYVASGRPVVGVGPVGGEADRVLRDTGAGRLHDWDDRDGITTRLLELYRSWERGAPASGASPDRAAPLSRRERTRDVAHLLDRLVAAQAGRRVLTPDTASRGAPATTDDAHRA